MSLRVIDNLDNVNGNELGEEETGGDRKLCSFKNS